MKNFIVMSKDNVQEVLNKVDSTSNTANICFFIGIILLVLATFAVGKGIRQHMRGESGTIMIGVVLVVACLCGFLGYATMKNRIYEQYSILAHNYDYTCWYEGKEVNYDTIDIDKYQIEVDSTGKMLKFTKPVRRGGGYYYPIVH